MIRQGSDWVEILTKLPSKMELFLILQVYATIIYFGYKVTVLFIIFAIS